MAFVALCAGLDGCHQKVVGCGVSAYPMSPSRDATQPTPAFDRGIPDHPTPRLKGQFPIRPWPQPWGMPCVWEGGLGWSETAAVKSVFVPKGFIHAWARVSEGAPIHAPDRVMPVLDSPMWRCVQTQQHSQHSTVCFLCNHMLYAL